MMDIREYQRDYDYVVVEGVSVRHETDKALLCDIGGDKVWIPKSQIHSDSEVYAADTEGKLIISKWIARQKELYDE